MLIFENKNFLFLFLLLIPLFFFALRNWRTAVHEISALKRSIILPTHVARLIKRLMLPVVLFFVLLALLGPKGNPHYSEEEIQRAQKQAVQARTRGNLILLIDTSASMRALDTPSRESRFDAAKDLADELIGGALQPYLVLYAVGSDLVKVVPRTLDKVFTRLLIKQLAINDGGAGTEFSAPFALLGQELQAIPDPAAIVLLSDGEDTALQEIHYPDLLQALNLKGRHVPIYTVGLGTAAGALVPDATYQGAPVTSHLNAPLLNYLSYHTGGKSFFLSETDSVAIVEQLISELHKQAPEAQEKALADPGASLLWDLYFQIPLLLAVLGLILYLTWPDTFFKKGTLMLALLAVDPTWERGATLYNTAVQKVVQGDTEEALDLLDQISPQSSPYVLSRVYFSEALATLGKEPDALKLLTALYLLRDAEKAACALAHEKGYPQCQIPYEIDQLKKRVKFELSKNKAQENNRIPLIKRLEQVALKVPLTLDDIQALDDPALEAAEKKLLAGEALSARLLLLSRLQELKRALYRTDTPIQVLKNSLDEARYTLILQRFAKEIPHFTDQPLLAEGQGATLQALAPFIQVSDSWRESQFLKKGCETAPWGQIIPLYEKGFKHEEQAALFIATSHFDEAYAEQKQGLKALTEALKLLENPPTQTPQSKEALSETIRVFQDLEISDRPFQLQPPPSKIVEKPW